MRSLDHIVDIKRSAGPYAHLEMRPDIFDHGVRTVCGGLDAPECFHGTIDVRFDTIKPLQSRAHFAHPYRAKQRRPVPSSGRCGLQPEQQRRDQLGHGRMDRHGPTELIVGSLRVDGIEDAVDSLVATCTEN